MINKKIFSIIIILFIVIFATPNLIFATEINTSNTLVTCKTVDQCDWDQFLTTLSKVKDFGFQLVVIMSVIFIVYAGSLYMFSGENAGKRTQANAIMSNVVIGFFLAAAGWLIVSAILHTLGVKDENLAPSELINNENPVN